MHILVPFGDSYFVIHLGQGRWQADGDWSCRGHVNVARWTIHANYMDQLEVVYKITILYMHIYIFFYNIPNIPSLIGGLKWCPFSAIEMMVQIHHFSHPDPVCKHHCRLVRSRLRMSVLRCQLRRNCDLYSKNRWALRFQYCSMTAVRRIAFLIPFFWGVQKKRWRTWEEKNPTTFRHLVFVPGVLFMAHAEVGWLQNSCMNFLGPGGPQMLAGAAGSAWWKLLSELRLGRRKFEAFLLICCAKLQQLADSGY